MEAKVIIINSIVYLILTSFLLYLWINEKKIAKKIRIYRDIFSEKIIKKFNIENEKIQRSLKKTVNITETIISAIALVLLIQHFYLGNFLVPTGSMIPTIVPKDRLFGNMLKYKFALPERGEILVFKEPIQNKFRYTKRLVGLPGEKIQVGNNGKLLVNGKSLEEKKYENNYLQRGLLSNKEWIIPKKGDTIQVIGASIAFEDGKTENIEIEKLQGLIKNQDDKVKAIVPHLRLLLNGKDETGPILDFKYDEKLAKKLIKGEKITLKEDYYFVLGDNSGNSLDSRYWGFVAHSRIMGKTVFRFWPINRIGIVK